jgi:hypothetical protein
MQVDDHGHNLSQLHSGEGEEIRFMATRDHQSVARAQWVRVRDAATRSLLAVSSALAIRWQNGHRSDSMGLEAMTAVGLEVE